MKKNTIEYFHKIEKEIKKLLCVLISVKDENEALKNRVNDLELFKSSMTKGMNKNQKMMSEYNSLKNNNDKLRQERDQLREKVGQMLKKLESFNFY